MKIAITGGIGSGKSAVLGIIKSLGYTVVSADDVSSRLTSQEDVLLGLKTIFPSCVEIVDEKPSLNKKNLSNIVFNDKDALQKLNGYLHPLIMQKIFDELGQDGFAEIPLLFENGFEKYFDQVIVVLRDKKDRISSVNKRSGLTENEVVERMKNQIDYDDTDFSKYKVIKNDGDLATLQEKVKNVINSLGLKV